MDNHQLVEITIHGGICQFRCPLIAFKGLWCISNITVNTPFQVMRHHLFVGVAVAVKVVDQGIHRRQPFLSEHRIGTVALAHVIEPLAHCTLVGAGSQHRQRQYHRYDSYDSPHVRYFASKVTKKIRHRETIHIKIAFNPLRRFNEEDV